MTKNSQLMVIVFISTIQLAMTLLAVAWLFGWIHERTAELAKHRVDQVNRVIAEQTVHHIDALTINDLRVGGQDWHKLQDYIKKVKLPDEGFVSIIDENGAIVCHPDADTNRQILGQTWDSAVIHPKHKRLVDIVSNPLSSNQTYALLKMGDSTHMVHGKFIQRHGLTVLAHQRISGVHAIDTIIISSLKSFSFAIALIIGLVGTILNVFMVKRIVDHDRQIQIDLEQKVDERAEELKRTKNAIIFGLAKLAESRDNDTGEHLDRIRKYVTILAEDLQHVYEEIDEKYIHTLGIASSLHDIGKVGIPDSILLKPGRLTSLERGIMEKHTIIGGECLEAIDSKLGDNDFLEMAREVAYWHHEQWDGCGYPHKLADDQIPISARIVAVADVYDALTSRRPYKRGMTHTESRAIIVGGSGQKFDPEVVAAFLRHEAEFQKVARRYQNTTTTEPTPTNKLPAPSEMAASSEVSQQS